jgi:hypothetical protein
MWKTAKPILITAGIAIVAVIVFNKFLRPLVPASLQSWVS